MNSEQIKAWLSKVVWKGQLSRSRTLAYILALEAERDAGRKLWAGVNMSVIYKGTLDEVNAARARVDEFKLKEATDATAKD